MKTALALFITLAILSSTAFARSPEERGVPATTGPYGTENRKGLNIMNPAIGLILDTFYYNTNLSADELEAREIPGYRTLQEEGHGHAHGEAEKGFNLRSAELSFFAPADPYFNLYITIPVSETDVELEEAYFVTTSLPAGLQIKAGKFRSGFGRFNAFHQHARNFVDSPLPYRAFLGDEGLIEKGVQITYLPDLPVYTLMGLEVLQGSNEVLFADGTKDGPHAYGGFVKTSVELTEESTILLGASVVHGDTKTSSIEHGSELVGNSTVYGAEFTYKWKPSRERSLVFQGEYLLREQRGDYTEDTTVPTPPERLERRQDGLYLQALYQSGRWRAGARYDVLGIFEDHFILSGTSEDFGSTPYRVTGSLEFTPTEFSRIRLQYNHDRSAREGRENNELFLQFILSIGAHGAHTF